MVGAFLRVIVIRLLLVALLLPTVASARPRAVTSASFDWDDNTVIMSSRTYLKSKTGAPELALTTAEWSRVQPLVGKPGEYADRYRDPDKRTGAFRDMGDYSGTNTFLRDLRTTVDSKSAWRGPSWDAFVEQLSTPQGARRATIITAREHASQTIFDGLKWLREKGLIRYLPPRQNLYAVNRPDIALNGKPLTGTTPARKLAVQRMLLDGLQTKAERGHGRRQTWHFSDDDWANFDATRVGLRALIAEGRWPNVDIIVHYTGDDPAHPRQVATLTQ